MKKIFSITWFVIKFIVLFIATFGGAYVFYNDGWGGIIGFFARIF